MKYIFPCVVAVSLLAGCTSATRESVNVLPQTAPQVSPTLKQSEPLGLKRVVAIARFSDETKHSSAFLVNNNGEKIGKQASDILSARLAETQKFIMLERADLGKVISENQFSGNNMDKVGAEFLIVGSISQFGRTTKSEVGMFSRNKIQQASATVNVRLLNTHTGEIVYSEEASGEATSEANHVFNIGESAGYDSSLDDKAISAAISKLVSNIVENLMDSPWRAYLVGQQQGVWMMTGGKTQGVTSGQVFDVVQKGAVIKNPQTGMLMTLPGKKVAQLKVTGFAGTGNNEVSLCELVSGNIDAAKLGELVVEQHKAE